MVEAFDILFGLGGRERDDVVNVPFVSVVPVHSVCELGFDMVFELVPVASEDCSCLGRFGVAFVFEGFGDR